MPRPRSRNYSFEWIAAHQFGVSWAVPSGAYRSSGDRKPLFKALPAEVNRGTLKSREGSDSMRINSEEEQCADRILVNADAGDWTC
jgi:hypothetical protein